MIDSWRFAVGTLTTMPIRPPRRLTRDVVGRGLALGPLAVLPMALAVVAVLWGGRELHLAPIAVAATAVAVTALGSRGLHLDGLADTIDGLAASYDRERALAVMRTGDVGPAGTVAVVLVLLVQVGALATLLGTDHGWWIAGVLVCVSRAALVVTAVRSVPAARPDGLGATAAGSIGGALASTVGVIVTTALCAAFSLAGQSGLPWWRALVCVAAAAVLTAAMIAVAVRRLGGVTGDVMGAAVELALAALLVAAT